GAYPNNGSTTSGQPGPPDGFNYVSTTSSSTDVQTITGYLTLNSNAPAFSSVEVIGSSIDTSVSASSAASGITVNGCADFSPGGPCLLYPIITAAPPQTGQPAQSGQPALYLDLGNPSGVRIVILTTSRAINSPSMLPLQQTAGSSDHELTAQALTVTGTQ